MEEGNYCHPLPPLRYPSHKSYVYAVVLVKHYTYDTDLHFFLKSTDPVISDGLVNHMLLKMNWNWCCEEQN